MTDVATRLGAALADRYRLERELGAGGMATVYLAQDIRHDRRVAIKVLRPELAAVIGAERFLAEIRTTANLQHPHILPLFDSGQAGGPDSTFLFYVMPYIEGESLRDRLTREKQLPIPDAVRMTGEVADALDYAHRHGVVHRDIKPENILLHDGRALVADFGIALAASKAGESRMTQTGMSLGTPSYMSPEQAMGEREIGPRSDIYSLGATAYEMLVGDPPFSGNTAQSIVAKVMTEKPIPPSRLRDTVPAPVERAVLTALQKLPADRFGSAKEFAEALTDGRGAGRHDSATRVLDVAPGRHLPPRRRALVPSLLALTIFSALSALYLYTSRPLPDSGSPIRFALDYAPGVRVATPITNPLAISPDGSVVAFSGRQGNGPFQIFVRPMADLSERALPGTEGGEQPCFSPDGKWIAFVARHQLKKVPLAGGAPSLIADVPGLMYGCSWTSDGRIVVSRGYRLEIVPDVGGTPGPLSPSDTTRGYLVIHPKVLPDGKTVITTHWRGSAPTARLWRVTLGAGQATDLGISGGSFLGLLDGHLIYGTSSGTLMAAPFDARQGKVMGQPVPVLEGLGGTSILAAQAALSPSGSLVYQAGNTKGNLVLVDMRGGVRSVVPESHNYSNPRFSPDGTRIAVSLDERGTRDIWVYDLRSRTLSRATTEGTSNDRPEWANDTRIVFRSNRGGEMAYWSQAADGSGQGEVFVAVPGREMWEGVPSGDGRWFLYRTGTVGSADIWVRGVERDTIPRLLLGSAFTEWAPRPSPDGRWVAYESDESGEYEVYVRPLAEGGTRLQVSVDGGVEPIWSPDGKRVFYWRGEELMMATLTTTPMLSVTARALLFRGDAPTTTGHANYDVSPDGTQIVLVRPLLDSIRTVVIHNWDQELRTRLAGTGK